MVHLIEQQQLVDVLCQLVPPMLLEGCPVVPGGRAFYAHFDVVPREPALVFAALFCDTAVILDGFYGYTPHPDKRSEDK